MAAAPVVSLLMAAAPLLLRPETFGCVPDGRTLCTAGIRKAIASCPTAGCVVDFAGPGTYLTQPFNLTSNLELRIGPNATILGTSEDRYNLNRDWPILPWAEYPSLPTRNTNPSFQAVVRGYNLTNVSIVAQPGGMLDCGGTYWICQAFGDAKKAAGFCGDPSTPGPYCLHPPCNASCGGAVGHKPGPCPPGTPTRPRCVHLIGTDHIRVTNLTMRNSPFWNLHFQFSSDVIVDGVQIYQFPGAANADGIDIDSTRDVVVKNTMVDSNDDMLCVKSGANWLGRQAGVPSENIIFQDCEIRSGHGLTLGSEMSGGVRNVTYRNIFYNVSASCTNADPRNCGGPKPRSFPGGVHFKTQRGRGGYLIDIMYDNIYGDGVSSAISFTCLHGAGPPTNATATPVLRNITVQNMALTGTVGDGYGVPGRRTCAYIQTLEESPIDGLYLKNISISGSCNAAFDCSSLAKRDVARRPGWYELYATGNASEVTINRQDGIGSPVHCHFLNQPPPPPPKPPRVCTVTKNLGCYNSTTTAQAQALLPTYVAKLHDHVTLEACAAACDDARNAAPSAASAAFATGGGGSGAAAPQVVAGIRDGNHCYCGAATDLATPAAHALNRPQGECLIPAARCPCASGGIHGCNCRCSGNLKERCGDTDRLLAFSFACKPLPPPPPPPPLGMPLQ